LGEELVSGDCTHSEHARPEPAADSFGAFGPKARRFYRERDSGEDHTISRPDRWSQEASKEIV
jgi:hypothetical protein